MLYDALANRRAIIGRRALADALTRAGTRADAVAILKPALDAGRAEIARRLEAAPADGRGAALAGAYLIDQLIRLAYDFTTHTLYRNDNPSTSERLTIAAVGGYGRAEMAPFSDIDIAFLTPWKQTGWTEQVIESMLYLLWDLGLKVGHSSRGLDEMVRMAKSDLTIRTALLEARYVWGDRSLYDEAARRFDSDVVDGSARVFVAEKLAERDARHKRMGDSRYVVEPNVKEGKGGLRDLHALFWIGKYVHRVGSVVELVGKGLLTAPELRRFQKAENFLLAVRCHLHLITRRAEDRLTFDVQSEIARRMRYRDGAGRPAVERFMQHYFLTAKTVGDLTGVFLAHLDDSMAPKGRRFALSGFMRRPRALSGFVLDRGRLTIPDDKWFRADPVRLLELFAVADRQELEIHPQAMRIAARDAKLIDAAVRADPRANALFLDVLTSPRDPETVLRWMNEATVFGRFIPDFGRVVAQMQFDMYHHYTVDEHTIRAVGLLSQIEKGALQADHPLASVILKQTPMRRALYASVLLHDIAKGRGGDHSILGAEVAQQLCPRLGLSAAETETVAWLVRHHLLMSATAFKRDLTDFKTITDFAEMVQSHERLRLLLALTVVDIRAVGPGVWNSWKRQLLGDLYESAEEVLRLGHKQSGRSERVAAKQASLKAELGWDDARFAQYAKSFSDGYWIAEPDDILLSNARHIAAADGAPLHVSAAIYPARGATLVTVTATDHPGLFYRLAGAIHLAGASIIDARIHTTRDGLALDNFLVQDPFGQMFDENSRLARLTTTIGGALESQGRGDKRLAERPPARPRADAFPIAANIIVDNKASNRHTVIEVNARDRPALLADLAHALLDSRVTIRSAHVATYGERAVDTFYVTDLIGEKIEAPARLKTLEARLLDAAAGEPVRAAA
ncbi:Bifunctional uridylyltransferase/uridylyl-removing enzyme [Sphingomonas antarctica]|uniref:[protein-PII] uridylyltransferase n=1 Tax=Sphingomonas antarctica TaxID=2040274 RepID=UPI0039ED3277